MPTLIDGHNLIPKLGLRLDSPEDELELLERLNRFCQISRKTGLEVYFDDAPFGRAGARRQGLLTAHFVQNADEAIRQKLKKLGRAARNWNVVTSDRQVQAEARSAGAAVHSSEEFAAQVIETLRAGPPPGQGRHAMTEKELGEWLSLFGESDTDTHKL
jgi:hypothetical protein